MNEITQPETVTEDRQSEVAELALVQESPVAVVAPATSVPAVTEGPGALLSAIVSMARDPSVDADKLEKLLAMQERMEAREAERSFNAAMMRLPPIHVKKNGTIDLTNKDDRAANRAGRSVPFARWEDMARIIEPLLEEQGFRLSFNSEPRPGEGGGLVVTGTLLHRDGHSRSARMPLALDTGPGRNNLQAQGSTLSYGKRYTTEMLLNIVRDGDDDDGKAGGQKFVTKEQIDEISNLVNDTDTDPKAFLEWVFGDEEPHNYAEIPVEKFVSVVNALKSKQRRQKMEGAVKP